MTDKSPRETIYVSHDIEKTGSFLIKNPINSIGFFISDSQGKCLETFKMNIKVCAPARDSSGKITSYGDFEPRCWNEFYSKLSKEIYNKTLTNPEPKSATDAWKTIAQWINALEVKYPTCAITFITDNASFDTASIDYALELYADRAPMRYSTTGAYRNVLCSSAMTRLISKEEYGAARDEIQKKVMHDHDPVHDAEFILRMHFAVRDKFAKRV